MLVEASRARDPRKNFPALVANDDMRVDTVFRRGRVDCHFETSALHSRICILAGVFRLKLREIVVWVKPKRLSKVNRPEHFPMVLAVDPSESSLNVKGTSRNNAIFRRLTWSRWVGVKRHRNLVVLATTIRLVKLERDSAHFGTLVKASHNRIFGTSVCI